MKISEWVEQKYKMDGWWAGIQFDKYITWFGTKIENLLSEFDPKSGKPVHTLDKLLFEEEEKPNIVGYLSNLGLTRVVRK